MPVPLVFKSFVALLEVIDFQQVDIAPIAPKWRNKDRYRNKQFCLALQLGLRGDRLRQRVEADSDTTATALRTISTTFDNTLVDVRGRLDGCGSQIQDLQGGLAVCGRGLDEAALVTRCVLCPLCKTCPRYIWNLGCQSTGHS